ncbi:FmdE, molybdenum formylmethanofuran dehydrogenase operon [Methanobrevibacter cuticularis]|uniref:FmdE, molybdenum formylmethanofuran dehydrogenase operon n=1 Tax=Methanobrevibacter cuticularis TaxID=47311 RepID=A0A166DI26_9EURY|nr:FmdE family protein [Methanobrevibacter cuticularis]KZX15622.1 FmdE, molybdenum formylmethanofuran dehydrogenase operon [Methanobrevibacter cuticularis]
MADLYKEQLEKAGKFHGDICGGIISGTKLAMYGLEQLGMDVNKKNKNLMVFLEIDRCMSDAVQAVTGCSLGRRSLKLNNYGKFAATFYDISTGKAIRISDKEDDNFNPIEETTEEKIERYANTLGKDLFKIQEVEVDIDENELPGKPRDKAICSVCNERIMDGKQEIIEGKILCKSCLDKPYYKII